LNGYYKYICINSYYASRALQRWLRPENDESSSRALAREIDIVRWAQSFGDAVVHTRFYFSLYVFFKKKIGIFAILNWWGRYEFITPTYSYYARLFLLRPVLFPGCYGHVYVYISYPMSHHAIILKWKIKLIKSQFIVDKYKNLSNFPL
jgi:hypothetical protein